METTVNVRKQPKYWAISIAAVIATAFVLVQPGMQASYAVIDASLVSGGFDQCDYRGTLPDPLTMNSVKNGQIVKTIISEKEIYDCFLNQGNIAVIVDVTTYIEIFENITSHDELSHSVLVTTCIKDVTDGQAVGCEVSETPDSGITPVAGTCTEEDIEDPAEMNTVNKGTTVKTIVAQKEQFLCVLPDTTVKKVDEYIITEIFENLATGNVTETNFLEVRCVVVVSDDDPDTNGASVETCRFAGL